MSEMHEHVDPRGAYIKVYLTLMVLLVITVAAYFLKFDEWFGPQWGFLNTMIALIIATTKTALVMLVFMHLRHSTKLTWVISGAGFIWLGIMIVFTFADYMSRSSIPENNPIPSDNSIPEIVTNIPPGPVMPVTTVEHGS